MPAPFPFSSIAACRAFYWLDTTDPEAAKRLATALYAAGFGAGKDIARPESVADIAGSLGLDRDAILAGMQDAAVKDRLRREVDAAVAKGVFGSPFTIVDGEAFWGNDRLDQIEHWLRTGGW
jgi:2-hydroxychromene-2-carboxylate isomerase